MTDTEARIALRIVKEMLAISSNKVDINMFMGMGLALAFVYEESTGRRATSISPKELMQWACELPQPTTRQ